MDEATPHLHIDYIPVGHYKRGQDTQNGIAQALKEMSFGEGKQAIARWRAAEVEVLNKNCLEHGIKPLAPEKARGTLEVEEYKEQRRQADELAEQNAQVKAELGEKREMLKAVKEKTAKLAEIDSIETGKTVFGGKVTVSQEDWQNITDLAKKKKLHRRNRLRSSVRNVMNLLGSVMNWKQSCLLFLGSLLPTRKPRNKRDFSPVRS